MLAGWENARLWALAKGRAASVRESWGDDDTKLLTDLLNEHGVGVRQRLGDTAVIWRRSPIWPDLALVHRPGSACTIR